MKYKYKKSMYIIQMGLSIVCSFMLLIFLYHLTDRSERWLRKTAIILSGFFVAFLGIYSTEYFNRYVEFNSEFVRFNSYRLGKQVHSLNVRYEDILSLESIKIPFLGIYKVKLKANNIPWTIPITWCMANRNELFYNICIYAQKSNPQVYIDSRLNEFMEKRQLNEADKT